MKRRTFLKVLAVLAAAGKLPKGSFKRVRAAQNGLSVLVVGAGASGIAAARTLVDEGYTVTILEGRDRIGGRLWTDRRLGVALDMGGAWIQGTDGNPVSEVVEEFGIETLVSDEENALVYASDGELYTDDEVEELLGYADEVQERVYEIGEESDTDMSWGAAVEQVFDEEDLSQEERRAMLAVLHLFIEIEYAVDIDQLSLWHGTEDKGFGGGNRLFPDGYIQVIEAVSRDLDIRLEHLVQRIAYGDSGVTVSTNQGDFSADYAIVTLPLGVLKKGSVSFEPALPDWKSTAINHLNMGVLNKTYLRFPSVFWDEDTEWITYESPNKGEWSAWLNMYYYHKEPILLGFNSGSYAVATEAMSDEEIIAAAMQILRTIYGDDIPNPDDHAITRWNSDPFSYGSYSYVPPFSSREDNATLALPVGDRLYFAGEATNGDYAATVHGAIFSGIRAAEELMG